MKKIKLGIIGCGGIANEVIDFVVSKLSKQMCVSCLYDIDSQRVIESKVRIGKPLVKVASSIEEVVQNCDLVLETAVGEIVKDLLLSCIKYKKDVILLSIGGIFSCQDLIPKITKRGINVYHPSGAIAGVDAVYAASYSDIKKLTLTTSKPPQGLAGQDDLKKAKNIIFRISARGLQAIPAKYKRSSNIIYCLKI